MTERLARPTANQYATDPDVAATRRAVLRLLADLPRWESISGRTISQRIYGTDFVGRSRSASAIGWLLNERFIERGGAHGGAKRYRITDLGRERLTQAETVMGEAQELGATPAKAAELADALADLPPCSEES